MKKLTFIITTLFLVFPFMHATKVYIKNKTNEKLKVAVNGTKRGTSSKALTINPGQQKGFFSWALSIKGPVRFAKISDMNKPTYTHYETPKAARTDYPDPAAKDSYFFPMKFGQRKSSRTLEIRKKGNNYTVRPKKGRFLGIGFFKAKYQKTPEVTVLKKTTTKSKGF